MNPVELKDLERQRDYIQNVLLRRAYHELDAYQREQAGAPAPRYSKDAADRAERLGLP